MTLYGIDISKYQWDNVKREALPLHLIKEQGFSFVTARYSIGDSDDPLYHTFRTQAHLHHLPFGAYHYITTDTPMHKQAQVLATIGSTPVMVDAEQAGLTWCQIEQFVEACFALGVNLKGLYLPHWFWQRIGGPNLNSGPTASLHLIASSYINGHDHASKLYPGDSWGGWASYGGKNPVVLQFSSSVKIDGWPSSVDGDAYKGSLEQLKATGLVYFWRT